jgi:hypothetical protein
MKNTIVALVILVTASTLSFAQKDKNWVALSEMKALMKQTFPPLIKNGNLGPARKNAAAMLVLAQNLENGKKPRPFTKKSMKDKFEAITKNAQVLTDLVAKNASDEEVKVALSILHGSFAEIAHHKKAGHQGHGSESH